MEELVLHIALDHCLEGVFEIGDGFPSAPAKRIGPGPGQTLVSDTPIPPTEAYALIQDI